MIATVLFGLCFILADVAVGHSDVEICNAFQCITCHHCTHKFCPSLTKLTCYPIVKRGGGWGGNNVNYHDDCVCQPEYYCDGFYPCHNWHCPDFGFIPQCNIWNHTCTCVHPDETCSGSDVSTCKITNCNSQEKLYCDHGFCSCKSLNYCNQNNADCANHSCKADLGESPFCNVTRCQCAVVVDTCQGSDTSTCRHLNCNGQFMHQICSNGVCQCQLNPSCSLAVECTEINTVMQIGTITQLECKSQYGLFTDCENGRCQCFQNISSTTTTTTTTTAPTTIFTVPTTTASTTRSTTPQKQTTTITSTTQQPTTTRGIITEQQTSSATTGPSTPTKELITTQPIPNAPMNPSAATCASRMDCNQNNTHATFLTFTMPCPVDHIDCVNNKCFCSIDKITTTPTPTTTTTTAAPSISCHQCGDPDANLPCDLRTVYMGQPSQCLTGSYCMTDVVQGSDGSVAIYKRCVDELTCRNEWMAQSSDQDRCLRYAESPIPGQYTCHYCCTVDGCNSKIVPDAKYFYSSSASINN